MDKLRFEIGATAAEVIEKIVASNLVIRGLQFPIYLPSLNLEERQSGKTLHVSHLLNEKEFPEPYTMYLPRNRITSAKLNSHRALDDVNKPFALGVYSFTISFGGNKFHLPMMDFQCGSHGEHLGPEKFHKIEEFLHQIKQSGILLLSGRGYHFYGYNLMHEDAWRRFIANCGNSGLVNPRFLYNVFADDCVTLRISSCELRPVTPAVIYNID